MLFRSGWYLIMEFNVGDLIIINYFLKKKKISVPAYVIAVNEPDLEIGRRNKSITYRFWDGLEQSNWIINIQDNFTRSDKRYRWVHHPIKD